MSGLRLAVVRDIRLLSESGLWSLEQRTSLRYDTLQIAKRRGCCVTLLYLYIQVEDGVKRERPAVCKEQQM